PVAMRSSAARAAASAPSRSTVMKALSSGLSVSMRLRNRLASSTAEICRASSARRSSGREALIMGWAGVWALRAAQCGSFDDFRYEIEARLGLRRDLLEGVAAVGLGDKVGAQAGGEFLRVAHRLDAGGVHRLHLFDEAEDAVELVARGLDFGL